MYLILAQNSAGSEALAGGWGAAASLAFLIAAVVISVVWLLLPFLILGAVGKLRVEVEKSNALASDHAQQLTEMLAKLGNELAEASRATAVEVADSNFTLDALHKTLTSLDAHLATMERDAQHTNRLLEWVGQRMPANQTGSTT